MTTVSLDDLAAHVSATAREIDAFFGDLPEGELPRCVRQHARAALERVHRDLAGLVADLGAARPVAIEGTQAERLESPRNREAHHR
jgi:hypothetical protein